MNMKRFGALALCAALSLSLLAGCKSGDPAGSSSDRSSSSSSGSSSQTEEPTLDLTGVTDPYLATAGVAGDTVVAQAGGVDITALMQGAGKENRVCSPLNLYMALSMLAAVTDGETRQQILDALGAESLDALQKQTVQLWTENSWDDGLVTSTLANSIWLRNGYSYNEETLQTLGEDYYASAFSGEMGSDAYNNILRDWINEHTGNLLTEQAGKLELNADTVLALVSTLYYSASWHDKFSSAATTQEPSWRGSAVNCTVKSDANIRRGPGTDFGVLGVVPAGFTVSVDSYQDGWASVTWGDVSGYIATKLLNGLPAANGGTSTASNSTSGRYEGADVTCTLNSDANLRSGPATSYEVLTAVPAGFTVTVHSYANGWSCVTWGDTTGYISNSLINGLPTANGGKGGSSSGSTAGTSWYGGHDYSNVYDYSYYRSQNADLRAAFGNDANAYLKHFVDYGMAEGRQGRASFNVYTYRDEHPELWEKFGDNLRGYYLWACGIPQ